MHRTAVNTTEASDAAAQMVHAIRKHSGPKQFPFSAAAAAAAALPPPPAWVPNKPSMIPSLSTSTLVPLIEPPPPVLPPPRASQELLKISLSGLAFYFASMNEGEKEK
jgi:hypothetical protein